MLKTEVVIVGSVGIDTIETPFEKREEILGGSVSYACAASSLFAPTGMVGVVGTDFPSEYMALYKKLNIDLEGLQAAEGRTFRWSGIYDEDMVNRTTISTELNVFESFVPELPESYRSADYLLLGNITPSLQLHVLEETDDPGFVMADTMDLWINIARDDLVKVISKVDMLTLNDSEARLLTGEYNLRKAAAKIMEMGPEYLVIKKGEHGAMLISSAGIFLVPAYPVQSVADPTGAGDSFAGGFLGYLAREGSVNEANVRNALFHGSVVASFGVEAFSLDRLETLRIDDVEARMEEFKAMVTL